MSGACNEITVVKSVTRNPPRQAAVQTGGATVTLFERPVTNYFAAVTVIVKVSVLFAPAAFV
jgi:hypothetical protein